MVQQEVQKKTASLREQITQELREQITQELREQITRELRNTTTFGKHQETKDDSNAADSKVQTKHIRGQAAVEKDPDPRFPDGMHNLVVGMTKVDRDEFTKKFDLGVPLDHSDSNNNEVLLMYSNSNAMPSNPTLKKEAMSQTGIPVVSAEDATANCDFLHIVLQDHSGERRQCMAILGQHEAYHIQKYMRLPDEEDKLDPSHPLVLANRDANGRTRFVAPPFPVTTSQHWRHLQKYLGDLEKTLDFLRPLFEKVAMRKTVVVMVCNFGQSELLLNFFCSSKRRGLDLSSIVVFATDQETADIVTQVGGPTVVYLKNTFADMPTQAAGTYGDETYSKMMLAKVYCVHLPVLLGYDVLFQDVDMVWYQNPLDFFHNTSRPDASFDMYFQDDGNRMMYRTYSANTGFYYVRNNRRTVHFFNSFLMMGDEILMRRSHQSALHALLQEHASLYALKIKVYSVDEEYFPGGCTFHHHRDYMKKFVKGEVHPLIFHMSWTESKVDKLKFFQQMGEWFVADNCTSISSRYNESNLRSANTYPSCCLPKPNIVCHHPRSPSIIPCPNSTFWEDM